MNQATKPVGIRPKRWRRWALVSLLLLIAAIPGYGVFLEIQSRRPGVTNDNLRRLRQGMTHKQVESLLGPSTFEGKVHDAWEGDGPMHGKTEKHWVGKALSIQIAFDWDERVERIISGWQWPGAPKETLFDKIRSWIGRN